MTKSFTNIQQAPQLNRQAFNYATVLLSLLCTLVGLNLSSQVNAQPATVESNNITAEKTIGAKELQALTLAFAKQQLDVSAGSGRIEYRAAPMDSRLSLRRCEQALEFEPQKNNARAGRKLIKIRCNDSKPWSIFVPVLFDHWQTVVSAKRPIQRNDVISASDIELKEQKLGGLANDYLLKTDNAVGLLATRNIEVGKPLSKRGLAQAKWIKRGDEVVIVANSHGVSARMPGTAMTDGSKGQQINVRNRSSNRVIKARVTAPGKVETIM